MLYNIYLRFCREDYIRSLASEREYILIYNRRDTSVSYMVNRRSWGQWDGALSISHGIDILMVDTFYSSRQLLPTAAFLVQRSHRYRIYNDTYTILLNWVYTDGCAFESWALPISPTSRCLRRN